MSSYKINENGELVFITSSNVVVGFSVHYSGVILACYDFKNK